MVNITIKLKVLQWVLMGTAVSLLLFRFWPFSNQTRESSWKGRVPYPSMHFLSRLVLWHPALYMAPEMLLDLGYDEKADVYSFGIVLSELYTQDEPYNGIFRSFEGTFSVWLTIDFLTEMMEAVTKKGKRPDLPDDIPQKLKDLIQSWWSEIHELVLN